MTDSTTQDDPLILTWDQQRVLGSVVAMAIVWCSWDAWGGRLECTRAEPLDGYFRVDVDQASWPELTLLPGIGRVTAERIVADREQHGPFGPALGLDRVPGIGPKTLQSIRPWIKSTATPPTGLSEPADRAADLPR